MTIHEYTRLGSGIGISTSALIKSYLDNYSEVKLVRLDNTSEELLKLRAYFLVQSNTFENIHYCITIDMIDEKEKVSNKTSIKVISNEPNYGFRYAFVYAKNNIQIKELQPIFLNKLMYTKPPKETNPREVLTMNEKVFHAIHYTSKNKIKFTKNSPSFGQSFKPLSVDQMTILYNKEKDRKK